MGVTTPAAPRAQKPPVEAVGQRKGEWRAQVAVPQRDIVLFSRNLATMMASSVEIVKALDTLASQPENPNLGLVLSSIAEDLTRGSSLSQSASTFPRVFSPLFCSILKVGEETGKISQVLEQMSGWLERDWQTRTKVKSAFVYPGFVFLVSFILMMVMFTTVVPQFLTTFSQLKGELPLITRAVILCTKIIQNPGTWALAITGVLAIRMLLIKSWTDPVQGAQIYGLLLRIPTLGNILRAASLSRFASVLSVTIANGLEITRSVELACATSGNRAIASDAEALLAAVKSGETLSCHFLRRKDLYSPVLCHITLAGEEAATLSESMSYVAGVHSSELELAVHSLSSLMEPFLLVSVAIVVAVIMLAIFLPLYSNLGAIG